MSRAARLAVVLLGLAGSGCFSTTLRSGAPPGDAPAEFDEKWHSGFLLGLVETSGPYDLAAICPQGWSVFEAKTSVLNAIVELLTVGIYTPQTVTVICSASDASPPSSPPDDRYPTSRQEGVSPPPPKKIGAP